MLRFSKHERRASPSDIAVNANCIRPFAIAQDDKSPYTFGNLYPL